MSQSYPVPLLIGQQKLLVFYVCSLIEFKYIQLFICMSLFQHIYSFKTFFLNYIVTHTVKNPPAMQERQVQSLGWEDPLKGRAPHSVFLPGESHGQRSLVGYSPGGHRVRQD